MVLKSALPELQHPADDLLNIYDDAFSQITSAFSIFASMKNIKTIAIFCGSSAGASEVYENDARSFVQSLCDHNIHIVYGGGSTGLMGVIAEEALKLEVHITGVVPHFFMGENVVSRHLNKLVVTQSMSERKDQIIALSDAFAVLPGGFGTFDELFEVATALQLGLINKPIGILNSNGYFNFLIEMLNTAEKEKFLRSDHLSAITITSNPVALIDSMMHSDYQAPVNWIEKLVQKNHF